jgi:hypothetical protein
MLFRGGDMYVTDLWQRSVSRRAALRYAEQGWRVIPGAVLINDRYVCGPLCPTIAIHPALDQWETAASSDWSDVDGWWRDTPYSVLLATGDIFDVIDVSAQVGAVAVRAVRTGPIAVSPAGRWMFLVAPGTALRPELTGRLDVVKHGPGCWIPAPPTRTPVGRIRWEVHPATVDWRVPDARSLQRVLVSQVCQPGPRLATFASTSRRLRTAA